MEHYSEYTTLFSFGFGIVAFLTTAGWLSAWWFSKKFEDQKDFVDEKIFKLETNIIKKLEYHERHDDERFADIKNDVWDIRVRNAARDGLTPLRVQDK